MSESKSPLTVCHLSLKDLRPFAGNARTHSAKQVLQIAASIREFGFNNPVLIDCENEIIAGHGRVAAAQQLGLETVPCVRLEHLSEAQKRAYILADNRLAEKAGWDRDVLAIELQHLTEVDVDFDVTVTGFEMGEIDVLLSADAPFESDADPADSVPALTPGPTVSRPGDIWQIGRHRLICGDARDAKTYDQLLSGTTAEMVFTDPPYNVKIDGHVSGLGTAKHREFACASGEMSGEQFAGFLTRVFHNLTSFAKDGAIHFICMDWRHQSEVLTAGYSTYTELKNLCVWAKTNGGMGSLYRSQHELIFVFKSGTAAHINNVELGKHGRYRTNVWCYAGANAFSATRASDLAMHPTVKPVALVADAILDCSNRNGLILDAFAGSGTTLIAAERTGRRCAAIEIDPHYCDVILRRIHEVAGLTAKLDATGTSFEDVARDRGLENAQEGVEND